MCLLCLLWEDVDVLCQFATACSGRRNMGWVFAEEEAKKDGRRWDLLTPWP